ncbi:ovalbumin-related protein Y-like isoform X1 [Pseudophryne corroboree]|uniref:ovalbumin-related protein Y-like isoform X1 n=1 Tax=Pseudophryne corroboree TaxID=495146 RepID=UPI00308208C9
MGDNNMSTIEAIVTANNLFTVDLAKQMSSEQNVAVSPLCMITALALVCLGAKGNTETQMKKVLHLENCEDVHSGLTDLITALTVSHEYILDIESTLFVEQTFNISKTYVNVSEMWYNSKPDKTDFQNKPRDAWNHINGWLKEKSEGTFLNVSEESISSDTNFVVLNTAYLLANWTQSFPEHKTENELFTLSTKQYIYREGCVLHPDGLYAAGQRRIPNTTRETVAETLTDRMSKNETVPIQLMSVEGTFNFRIISDEELSIIELPYGKSGNLCMYVILPDKSNGIQRVEQDLSYEKLNDWTNSTKMKKTFNSIFLPHFEINKSYSMKRVLSQMGMTDIFLHTKANLSDISQDSLYLSDVISLATVKADEDGTKESTSVDDNLEILYLMLPKFTFKADHPFIFIVKDKPTECFLFYGTFQHP